MPRGVCNDPVAEAARLAKISAAKKGRPHSPEHAANISAALTGRSLSPEHRARVSATRLRGEENPNWRGGLSLFEAHRRVKRVRGPARGFPCVDCGGGPAGQWSLPDTAACLSDPAGWRYSDDPFVYEARCHSCHTKYDHRKREERACRITSLPGQE